jgi:hypothetical protein
MKDGARQGRWTYWRADGSIDPTWSGVYVNDVKVDEAGAAPGADPAPGTEPEPEPAPPQPEPGDDAAGDSGAGL